MPDHAYYLLKKVVNGGGGHRSNLDTMTALKSEGPAFPSVRLAQVGRQGIRLCLRMI